MKGSMGSDKNRADIAASRYSDFMHEKGTREKQIIAIMKTAEMMHLLPSSSKKVR